MATKNYVSLSRLSTFLDNLKSEFAALTHKHSINEIEGYAIDSALSNTSTNPVQNKVLDAEFETIAESMNALDFAIDGKADSTHNHDDVYYTELEADIKFSAIENLVGELTNRLNALADSDDPALDQLSEIVAYIKSNKSLINDITTNKVNVSDIVNNLTTDVANKPLSAAQGVVIKASIDALQGDLDGHSHTVSEIYGLIVTTDELNYMDGATSNVQAQIDSLSTSITTKLNRSTAVNEADTNYTTIMARGSSINNADATPAVNGAIAWTYK